MLERKLAEEAALQEDDQETEILSQDSENYNEDYKHMIQNINQDEAGNCEELSKRSMEEQSPFPNEQDMSKLQASQINESIRKTLAEEVEEAYSCIDESIEPVGKDIHRDS